MLTTCYLKCFHFTAYVPSIFGSIALASETIRLFGLQKSCCNCLQTFSTWRSLVDFAWSMMMMYRGAVLQVSEGHGTGLAVLCKIWALNLTVHKCVSHKTTVIYSLGMCCTPLLQCLSQLSLLHTASFRAQYYDNSTTSNDCWKCVCLVSWSAAPCVWTLTVPTRNIFSYLLTYWSTHSDYYKPASCRADNKLKQSQCWCSATSTDRYRIYHRASPRGVTRLRRAPCELTFSVVGASRSAPVACCWCGCCRWRWWQ